MTTEEEKRLLLLLAIVELDGSGTKHQVLDLIEKYSWIKLTEYDREKMKSRNEIRWRNDLAFVRKHLVTSRYLSDEAWDKWQITEIGIEYFQTLCRQVQGATFQRLSESALLKIKNTISSSMLSDDNAIMGETKLREGGKIFQWTTRYERDPRLRARAIHVHGTRCMGCNFSFEQTYGDIGYGFIEVHYIKPVSTLEKSTIVEPESDMITLCSNCHSIVHRKKTEPLSLESLKAILSKKMKNKTV